MVPEILLPQLVEVGSGFSVKVVRTFHLQAGGVYPYLLPLIQSGSHDSFSY